MVKLPTALRSLWRGREGMAAVELGLFLPMFTAMLIILTDVGMGAYTQMQLYDAAQAGAEYAGAVGFNAANIETAVQSATSLSGITFPTTGPNPVNPAQTCECLGTGGTLSAATPAGGPPCTQTCPNGGTVGTYVTITAQTQYTMLFNYPGLSNPLTLTAQAMIRIK